MSTVEDTTITTSWKLRLGLICLLSFLAVLLFVLVPHAKKDLVDDSVAEQVQTQRIEQPLDQLTTEIR